MKTAAVHSRIDPEVKEQAESILNRLGLSPTEAIRIFYTQITLRNGLPFEVEIPNATTCAALEDSRKGKNLTQHTSTETLFKSWDSEDNLRNQPISERLQKTEEKRKEH